MAYKAEYIWIDGTEPTAKLRSKTKVTSQVRAYDGRTWEHREHGYSGSGNSE